MWISFYRCCGSEKRSSAKTFFECANWPIDLPQTGSQFTFTVKGEAENPGSQRLQTALVVEVSQTGQNRAYVWVDMEELKDEYVENWREYSPSS